jgi:hypothetical protein
MAASRKTGEMRLRDILEGGDWKKEDDGSS